MTKQRKRAVARILYFALACGLTLACCIAIWGLSAQDAPESAALSAEVTDVVVRVIERDQAQVVDRTTAAYQVAHETIRSLAHATLYAALAFFLMFAIAPCRLPLWKKALIAISFCFVYALSDEWHQAFVAGRASEWIDIGFDMGGACAGICAALLFRGVALAFALHGAFWRNLTGSAPDERGAMRKEEKSR